MNVLITSASRKVALVRAFQKALREVDPGDVIAVDSSPLSPALYVADSHRIVPPLDSPDFQDHMVGLCGDLEIDLLIPTRDEELPFFSERRTAFSTIGTTVMVADPGTIRVCQDKVRFLDFCKDHDFRIPESWYGGKVPREPDFPLFIKPRFGKGGANTQVVGSAAELEMALRRVPEPIVQRFIDEDEYTVDLFTDLSGEIISVIPRRRIRIVAGESFVGQTLKDPRLIDESIRLAQVLALRGHNTLQCFYGESGVTFIEVNPRLGGGASLGFAAGAHTPTYMVSLVKGKKVEPRIGIFQEGLVMLRYTEDLFLDGATLPENGVLL